MTRDMQPIGVGFGLMLGLVLAAPWLPPALLHWGVEVLFLLSAFLMRLADRRWTRRAALGGWISHLRMMPARLLSWAAVAVAALIADVPGVSPSSIVLAVAISEVLIYPLLSSIIGKAKRPILVGAIVTTVLAIDLAGWPALHYSGAFMIGMMLCACWLRGPDGDWHRLALALSGAILFMGIGWVMPTTVGWSITSASVCATLALAHLSTLRPHVAHWRPHGPVQFRPERTPPRPLV